jgi:hypothetical protein
MGKIIRISAVREVWAREQPHQISQGNDTAPLFFTKTIPFTKVFFRPEEVHGTSGVGYVEDPLSYGDGDMANQFFRFFNLNLAVLNLNMNRFTTIETYRINSYRLTRKKPADRQRFKRSLAKPLLFAVNGQAVIGRQIIERGKGYDVIGLGIKPTREPEGRE